MAARGAARSSGVSDLMREPLCALSFNLKVGVDSSPAALAADLARVQSARGALHLCSLQEVGRGWRMGVPLHQSAYLAAALSHEAVAFAPALTDARGGQFGVALTAAWGLGGVEQLLLPCERDEQRTLLRAEVSPPSWGGARVQVFVTHLSVVPEERLAQARCVAERVAAVEGPVLLLGDLNDLPGSEPLRALEAVGLRDPWAELRPEALGYTFSVKRPHRRIDYLLYRGLRCDAVELEGWSVSSDHLPLWGRFWLP